MASYVLGEYQVTFSRENLVGEGGFSHVYIGRNTRTEQTVAVKRVQVNDVTRNFVDRENELMCKLMDVNNENIVKFFLAQELRGFMCFVLEFCACGNLDDFMRYKNVAIGECARYMHEMSAGLQQLHHMSICHRDVKPANILVQAGDKIKLADFGLAKAFTTSSSGVHATANVGTRGWMAPEIPITDASRKSYSLPIDVFSLGLVFWAMLAHRLGAHLAPFRMVDCDLAEFMRTATYVMGKDVPVPDLHIQGEGNLVRLIKELIEQMLCYNPQGRYTIADVLDCIHKIRDELSRAAAGSQHYIEVALPMEQQDASERVHDTPVAASSVSASQCISITAQPDNPQDDLDERECEKHMFSRLRQLLVWVLMETAFRVLGLARPLSVHRGSVVLLTEAVTPAQAHALLTVYRNGQLRQMLNKILLKESDVNYHLDVKVADGELAELKAELTDLEAELPEESEQSIAKPTDVETKLPEESEQSMAKPTDVETELPEAKKKPGPFIPEEDECIMNEAKKIQQSFAKEFEAKKRKSLGKSDVEAPEQPQAISKETTEKVVQPVNVESKLQDTAGTLESQKKENESLMKEIAALKKQLETHMHDNTDLVKENKKLQDECNVVKMALEKSEQNGRKCEAERAKIHEAATEDFDAKVKQMTDDRAKELEKMKDRNKEVEEEIARLEVDKNDLEKQLRRTNDELEERTERVRGLKEDLKDADKTNYKLEEDLDRLREERNRYRDMYERD